MGKNNFGGSLLSSHGPDTGKLLTGRFGMLKVIQLAEIEEHALMYQDTRNLGFSMVATHANGYSCKELADRIIAVWEGKREPGYAIAQFDYILDRGGTGRSRYAIDWIVNQKDGE